MTGIAPHRSEVIAKARELVALGQRYGYQPDQLAQIVRQLP